MVMRSAMLQVLLGLAIGVPAAMMCVRCVASQPYEIKAVDTGTLVGAASSLTVAAALAGLIPALRAVFVDPVQALRSERNPLRFAVSVQLTKHKVGESKRVMSVEDWPCEGVTLQLVVGRTTNR